MKKSINNNCFAEVVQSNLQTWTGQTWQWNNFPTFGQIVKATHKEYTFFGIIYDIETGSNDSSRHVTAYKQSPEELMQEQPQVFEFLSTTFQCVGLGYTENNAFLPNIVPHPLPLHTFICNATTSEYSMIMKSAHSLSQLSCHGPSMQRCEEILLALCIQAYKNQSLSPDILKIYIQTCSKILRNDFQRLKDFLEKLEYTVMSLDPQLVTFLQ